MRLDIARRKIPLVKIIFWQIVLRFDFAWFRISWTRYNLLNMNFWIIIHQTVGWLILSIWLEPFVSKTRILNLNEFILCSAGRVIKKEMVVLTFYYCNIPHIYWAHSGLNNPLAGTLMNVSEGSSGECWSSTRKLGGHRQCRIINELLMRDEDTPNTARPASF